METYRASGPESANAILDRCRATTPGTSRSVSGGMLTFRSSPDYENPTDMGMDNTYMVTIMADDGTYMAMRNVTVTVTNVDEMGDGDPVGGDGSPHDGAAGWGYNHGGRD